MDDQTRKAYWKALSSVHALDEKTSYLNEDEVKVEEAIYSIRPENDKDGLWEMWAEYIEQRMAAERKLERLKFKLSGAVYA
jgi:hypothetical protein